MLNSVVGLLLALGILVTVHEFGHFWVARAFGVKVLRFSVGFGRPLWIRKDRHGTEFSVAWIPLGGYVKMLDEREGEVPIELRSQTFNQQPPQRKIAIALAGPLFNVLFAVLAFTLLYLVGVRDLAPWVDQPPVASLAADSDIQRGDRVLEIDDQPVTTFSDIGLLLAARVGDTGVIELTIEREAQRLDRQIYIERWLADSQTPDPITSLGLLPMLPIQSAVIGYIEPDGAAEAAGLQLGDEILEVNGRPVTDWMTWVEMVRSSENAELLTQVARGGETTVLVIRPRAKEQADGSVVGYIGAGVAPADWAEGQLVTSRYWFGKALQLGIVDTAEMVKLSYRMLWKMVTGRVSLKQVGGPISMAQLAGVSVASGFEAFIGFLALISLSLAIVNLLPVPVLDGGHVLIHSIEWMLGRPLSERAQMIGTQLGMAFIVSLMLLAFFNDINRLL